MFNLNWRLDVEELLIQWMYNTHDEMNAHTKTYSHYSGRCDRLPSPHLHISSNFGSTETPLMGCTAALVSPDVSNCTVNIKLTVGNKLAVWMKSVHSKTECYCTYTFTSFFFFFLHKTDGRKFYSFVSLNIFYYWIFSENHKKKKKYGSIMRRWLRQTLLYNI